MAPAKRPVASAGVMASNSAESKLAGIPMMSKRTLATVSERQRR